MHLTCIVGSFMILFAAAERRYEMKRPVTIQDNKKDVCNPSKDAIKCCICLEAINQYVPQILAQVDQKIRAACNFNRFLRKPCIKIASKIKIKVLRKIFPGGPLQSCKKFKMCK